MHAKRLEEGRMWMSKRSGEMIRIERKKVNHRQAMMKLFFGCFN